MGENHGKLGENLATLASIVLDVDYSVASMDDYDLDDLVRLTGYSARGIRHYIQLGLLPRPKLAGRATRYARETLGRLAAIRFHRAKGASIRDIKRALRADPAFIDMMAGNLERGGKVHGDGGFTFVPPNFAPAPAAAAIAPVVSVTSATQPLQLGERWVRVPLMPGLDLVMRDGAGEDVVAAARAIQSQFPAR